MTTNHPFTEENQGLLKKATTNLSDLAGVRQTAYSLANDINFVCQICFGVAHHQGWWTDVRSRMPLNGEFAPGQREHPINVPAKLMLISTELSEAFDAHKESAMDDHLSHHQGVTVELADTVIRIADLAGGLGLRLPAVSAFSNHGLTMVAERDLPRLFDEEHGFQGSVVMEMFLDAHRLVAFAMEGFRKGTIFGDDMGELKGYTVLELSLCDLMLKCFHMARVLDLPISEAINEKLLYNLRREDHKLENRAADGGKSV
jgi:hypothetical protein